MVISHGELADDFEIVLQRTKYLISIELARIGEEKKNSGSRENANLCCAGIIRRTLGRAYSRVTKNKFCTDHTDLTYASCCPGLWSLDPVRERAKKISFGRSSGSPVTIFFV